MPRANNGFLLYFSTVQPGAGDRKGFLLLQMGLCLTGSRSTLPVLTRTARQSGISWESLHPHGMENILFHVRPRMHVKARFTVVLFSLTLCLCGCSRSRTPAALALRIAGADRVVVWDWAHMGHLSMAGDEVAKLVKVVSSAKGGNRKYLASYGKTIEFYRGSNFLASIRFQNDVLKTEDEGE